MTMAKAINLADRTAAKAEVDHARRNGNATWIVRATHDLDELLDQWHSEAKPEWMA